MNKKFKKMLRLFQTYVKTIMNPLNENSINIENNSDAEDEEEQRRREEELADLLVAGINAFDDDGSTMNSTLNSIDEHIDERSRNHELRYEPSADTFHNNKSDFIEETYRNVDPKDQLQLLYDVRVREILKMKDDYKKLEEEKSNEIKILKNKLTLFEAEIRHLQVTLSNNESLLVERSENIKNLQENLVIKDGEIAALKIVIEDQNFEIHTYKSTVNELQMKLVTNNPFSNMSQKINSEETQRVQNDRITKLETLLQEQTNKVQILEKEKAKVEEDLKRSQVNIKDVDEENKMTIIELSKKLQSAQQQCKDLFVLGEAIKKESDHFKERYHQAESNKLDTSTSFQNKKFDKETLTMHLEKLKRMLLDKDIELNTLKAKLKFYDSDLNELFEYRNLLKQIHSYEFKPCSNIEHEEIIIFIQSQLQSYQQAIEDRNNQIMSLNAINKELQEKIEEMLQQTRNDIQNISQKYSLPQLETMNQELNNAEQTINELKEKLTQKDALLEENNVLLKDLKKIENKLTEENQRVRTQLQKLCLKLGISEGEIFEEEKEIHEMSKYGRIHEQLQAVLTHLESTSTKRVNFNVIMKLKREIESALKVRNLDSIGPNLVRWDEMLIDFLESLKHDKAFKQSHHKEMLLEGENRELKNENEKLQKLLRENKTNIVKLNEQLENVKKSLVSVEDNKEVLEKQLDNTKKELSKAKDEVLELHKHLNKLGDRQTTDNLSKEFKNGDVFQAQLLQAEIALRERLQKESLTKMQKIEEQYKKVIEEKSADYSKAKEKWKRDEANFREQFSTVLEDCGKKIEELENENIELRRRLGVLINEHRVFKTQATGSIERQNVIVAKYQKAIDDLNNQWTLALDSYRTKANDMARYQRNGTKKIMRIVADNRREMELVQQLYDEKLEKLKMEKQRK